VRRALLGAAVAAVLLAGACGQGDDAPTSAGVTSTTERPAPGPPQTTTSTTQPPSTTTTTSTPAPTTSTTPTTQPGPVVGGDLRQGDGGEAVRSLQVRLSELGYWLGRPDGVFGDGTRHAVVALQKAAGLERDGVVGPATRAALDAGTRPSARSTSGLVVEIDLARQLLLIVRDGQVESIFDTSTGRVAGSTPTGHWQVTRQIDGFRQSRLGLLYRPKYFYEGVAVHGYTSVPAWPASHGCVRLTYAAIDHVWAADLMPVSTPVWVY
jgi:peptidoglycan hydrolase-like protein with peptidoglycan-binding domain